LNHKLTLSKLTNLKTKDYIKKKRKK